MYRDLRGLSIDPVQLQFGEVDTRIDAITEDLAPLEDPHFTGTVNGITGAMVGLGNCDNTADSGKPVSNAQQAALDLKANLVDPAFTGTITGSDLTVTGTISIGGGLISNSIVSVGATSWVDVPNTQPRGAYLILARSEDDNESALVAAVSDSSDSEVGHVHVMTRKGDVTTNHYLAMQYPTNSNVQIKMNNGTARNVSIMVVRA